MKMKIHSAIGIGKAWCIHTGLNSATGIIPQLPISWSLQCFLACKEKQPSGFSKFIAPLDTASKFFHSPIANNCMLEIKGR
jgi:hypothetical protein